MLTLKYIVIKKLKGSQAVSAYVRICTQCLMWIEWIKIQRTDNEWKCSLGLYSEKKEFTFVFLNLGESMRVKGKKSW